MRWWLTLPARLLLFGAWFLGQMVRANWQVAADVLTPGSALTPGVVAYRPRSASPAELTVLSNLITLTPGTMTVDIDIGEGVTLYVLGLYAPASPAAFHDQLRALESRMLGLMRRPGRATAPLLSGSGEERKSS